MSEAADAPWDEDEYVRYLNGERRLYALALVDYGGLSPKQAEREALEWYPYQPTGTPFRGLIFHDLAWHWAMLRIHGDMYWVSRPELQQIPEAYRLESERLDSQPPG